MALTPAKPKISKEWAESLAIEALLFIASDPERLDPFLGVTGLDPGNLRAAAAEPRFLAGVVDYLAGNEQLLLLFAEDTSRDPREIGRARTLLGGPPGEWSS